MFKATFLFAAWSIVKTVPPATLLRNGNVEFVEISLAFDALLGIIAKLEVRRPQLGARLLFSNLVEFFLCERKHEHVLKPFSHAIKVLIHLNCFLLLRLFA